MATVNQPTATPTNKVAAAGIAGAVTTILLFIASSLGWDVPAEVGAAIATVISFLAGYLTKESV